MHLTSFHITSFHSTSHHVTLHHFNALNINSLHITSLHPTSLHCTSCLPFSSCFIWSLKYHFASRTKNDAPHYDIFSSLLLLPSPWAQILPSAPSSRSSSLYILSLTWDTQCHITYFGTVTCTGDDTAWSRLGWRQWRLFQFYTSPSTSPLQSSRPSVHTNMGWCDVILTVHPR